jgi:hypothetical protein
VIIPCTGHWVAEDAPEAMLAALTAFLAPYRATDRPRHTTPGRTLPLRRTAESSLAPGLGL